MPKRFSFSRVGRLTLLAAALTASPTFADSPASADDAKSPFADAVACRGAVGARYGDDAGDGATAFDRRAAFSA